jgi:hypothetical protein
LTTSFTYIEKPYASESGKSKSTFYEFSNFPLLETSRFWKYEKLSVKNSPKSETNRALVWFKLDPMTSLVLDGAFIGTKGSE